MPAPIGAPNNNYNRRVFHPSTHTRANIQKVRPKLTTAEAPLLFAAAAAKHDNFAGKRGPAQNPRISAPIDARRMNTARAR